MLNKLNILKFRLFSTISSSPLSGVRATHLFNDEVLYSFLSLHSFKGFEDIKKCQIKQFSHGQSNPTYLIINQNNQKYTLRKQPPGLISFTLFTTLFFLFS